MNLLGRIFIDNETGKSKPCVGYFEYNNGERIVKIIILNQYEKWEYDDLFLNKFTPTNQFRQKGSVGINNSQ